MRALLLAIAALSGCVHDNLVDCSNGVVCPSGLVCDLAHEGCVAPDQLTACEGLSDLAPCQPNGICHEGVCLPVGCGNGRVDPGEACDDGNTASADGCSSDCLSNEQCGNGTIDPVNREECDDGNLANHDGCDSRCLRETASWTPLSQIGHPARQAFAYAYDEARARFVVFGGANTTTTQLNRLGDTLQWNGVQGAWLDETSVFSPTPRYGAAMAYDAAHQVVVMFGGNDPGGVTNDTWLWDGAQWSLATTPVRPRARMFHSMAYDSRHHRVILFGGWSGSDPLQANLLADTWAWDGTTWTQLSPATSPPARLRAAMAYDPVSDQIVMAGGFIFGSNYQKDTWIFDGTDWHAGPDLQAVRSEASATYDPIDGGVVLAGGTGTSAAATGETLIFRNGAWASLASTSPFGSREYLAIYFDRERGHVIGGLGQVTTGTASNPIVTYGQDMNELAVTNDPMTSTWNARTAEVPLPGTINAPAIAYDAARGRIVAFGGRAGSAMSRTYELAGGTWTDVTPAGTSPGARDETPMAYDSQRQRSVLWGGINDPLVWEWDGAAWTSTTPGGTMNPTPRTGHQMVYDKISHTTVMFGGADLGSPPTTLMPAETWLWNGTAWQNATAGTAPNARYNHAMAFDEERGEIVLFGGHDIAQNRFGDTWTWTLAGGWVQRMPNASPAARANHTMTWDPVRRRVILFGGNIGALDQDDTWEWDGTTWNRLIFPSRPAPSKTSVLAYDGIGKQAILLGGTNTTPSRLRWLGSGPDDACELGLDGDGDGLAGCADPDCGARCTPLCPPLTSCGSPACGDGVCDPLESCRLCPGDCGACPQVCGDSFCDPSETCPGDCP